MAACSYCFATLDDGAETCARCRQPVGARAPVADGPTLPSWTEASDPVATLRPVPPPADPPTEAPATPAPLTPARPPGAPWQPPDASGAVPPVAWTPPPPTTAPPAVAPPAPPPPGPPVTASAPPAQPWAPPPAPGTGWPAAPPGAPPGPTVAVPVADGRDEDLDRANAIVLVVVSVIVALGIVIIAMLAANGLGPSLDEIEGAAPPAAAVEVGSHPAEVDRGR